MARCTIVFSLDPSRAKLNISMIVLVGVSACSSMPWPDDTTAMPGFNPVLISLVKAHDKSLIVLAGASAAAAA